MEGNSQKKANSPILGQEGEQPGHEDFPLPHGEHLQEAICCLPASEIGEHGQGCV